VPDDYLRVQHQAGRVLGILGCRRFGQDIVHVEANRFIDLCDIAALGKLSGDGFPERSSIRRGDIGIAAAGPRFPSD
jgi:hypothetical protein